MHDVASLAPAATGVRRLEIVQDKPAFGGAAFGSVGAYRQLSGWVNCDLDPRHSLNAGIVNLDKAPRNERGTVDYRVEFCLLAPADVGRGNGWLFYEVLNRGNKLVPVRINNAPLGPNHNRLEHPGNGFLMRQGHCILWTG